MEPACSSTVSHATAKMKFILDSIKFSLSEVFKCKLDKLTSAAEKQKSVSDVQKTEVLFNTFFQEVEDYIKTEKSYLQQQLKVILGDLSASNCTYIKSNHDITCDNPPSENPHRVSALVPSLASSNCDLDVGKTRSDPCSSSGNLEHYESSDLPETQTTLVITNQTPNLPLSISDMNGFPIDSNPTILNDKPSGNDPNSNSVVPFINPETAPNVNPFENAVSTTLQTNVDAQLNSKSNSSDPNEKCKTVLSPRTDQSNIEISASDGERRNEKEPTSEKVIDWLNRSPQPESLVSGEEDNRGIVARINNDDGEPDLNLESENVNSDVTNDDNHSTSGSVPLKESVPGSEIAEPKIYEAVIEISDESCGESVTSRRSHKNSCSNVIALSKDEDVIVLSDESSNEAVHATVVATQIRSPECSSKLLNGAAERQEILSESISNPVVSLQSLFSILTQKLTSRESDKAKKDLMTSSSSTSDGAESQVDMNWDSDATVVLPKMKKLKKKRKKGDALKNLKEKDAHAEVERLLNLDTLRKRRRDSESSDGSFGSALFTSSRGEDKKKKSKANEDELDNFSVNEVAETEIDRPDFQRHSETTKNYNSDDMYKEAIAADSVNSSEDECQPSPELKKACKTAGKDVPETTAKETEEKKKKRKYDPLLHGKFQLSESDSEVDKRSSEKCRSKKKKEELELSGSKKNSQLAGDQALNEEESESIDIFSSDPENGELSELNPEDDLNVIDNHQVPSILTEDNVQSLLQPQATVRGVKAGRKNIRSIVESTPEYKQAAEEEEEHQKRIFEKEMLLSQKFPAQEVEKLILDFDPETKRAVAVHPDLMAVLAKHQIEGVKFMWNRCFETVNQVQSTSGSGCILAHCMGLGKSLQIVTLVHTIINHPELNLRTVLIICPKSVILNWNDEFKKWLKTTEISSKKVDVFDLLGCKDTVSKESRLRRWQSEGGVMLMGYKAFCTLVLPRKIPEESQGIFDEIENHLVNPGPDVAVFDEGHQLKNASTIKNKAANLLQTQRRIILTGTPMQNNLMEYYYMVNFIKPNYLGDKTNFSNRFFHPINNGQFQDSTPHDVRLSRLRAHVLSKKLDGLVNRLESRILKNQLPERYEYILKLRLSELQIELYKKFLDSLRKNSPTETQETKILMTCDNVLANICSHPQILAGTVDSSSAMKELKAEADIKKCLEGVYLEDVNLSSKTALFFKILEQCAENGDKLLVFSQFLKTLNLLESFLKKASGGITGSWIPGIDYYRLDGKTSESLRAEYCRRFNSNDKRARLFLLSTKAGSLGLNLTGANRAIIFDVSWNPSVDSQSAYRIYRFGQSKPCYIYRFVMKGTMEEKKYHRQVYKLSTSSRVVDKRQVGRHFEEKYLRSLYVYNFNYDENCTQSTRKPLQDKILSNLLPNLKYIDGVEEHDTLLMNILDEELTVEDQKEAMEDYEREESAGDTCVPNVTPCQNSEGSFEMACHQNAVCPPPQMPPLLQNMIEPVEVSNKDSNNAKFDQPLGTACSQINPQESEPLSEPVPPLLPHKPKSLPLPPPVDIPDASSNRSKKFPEPQVEHTVRSRCNSRETEGGEKSYPSADVVKNSRQNSLQNLFKDAPSPCPTKEHRKDHKDRRYHKHPEKHTKYDTNRTSSLSNNDLGKFAEPQVKRTVRSRRNSVEKAKDVLKNWRQNIHQNHFKEASSSSPTEKHCKDHKDKRYHKHPEKRTKNDTNQTSSLSNNDLGKFSHRRLLNVNSRTSPKENICQNSLKMTTIFSKTGLKFSPSAVITGCGTDSDSSQNPQRKYRTPAKLLDIEKRSSVGKNTRGQIKVACFRNEEKQQYGCEEQFDQLSKAYAEKHNLLDAFNVSTESATSPRNSNNDDLGVESGTPLSGPTTPATNEPASTSAEPSSLIGYIDELICFIKAKRNGENDKGASI